MTDAVACLENHMATPTEKQNNKSFPEHAIYPKEPAVVQGAAGALGGFSGANSALGGHRSQEPEEVHQYMKKTNIEH